MQVSRAFLWYAFDIDIELLICAILDNAINEV